LRLSPATRFRESGPPARAPYTDHGWQWVVTPPVKARSGHIILEGHRSYKDLVRVYPEIHKRVVEANRPFMKEAEPLLPEVLLDENLRDLKRDRKPAGYNRQDAAGIRLIFPIPADGRPEFYFYKAFRAQEVVQITEQVSALLRRRSIKHSVEYDRLPLGAVRGLPPGSGLLPPD
jgi:hypothetical protein